MRVLFFTFGFAAALSLRLLFDTATFLAARYRRNHWER